MKVKSKMQNIKLFLTDCDGVLTDGGMYYLENNNEAKKFNTKDGMAFELLKKRGLLVGIITGEKTKIVENRANKLKVDILIQNSKNKLNDIYKVLQEKKINFDEVLYVGDDINDLELLNNVAFSSCPKDAIKSVKRIVDYVSKKSGGEGVIRDIVEKFFIGSR